MATSHQRVGRLMEKGGASLLQSLEWSMKDEDGARFLLRVAPRVSGQASPGTVGEEAKAPL